MKVKFVLATRRQVVSNSDPREPFVFTVRNATDTGTGEPVDSVSTNDTQVDMDLPSGNYRVTVSRFNNEAVATFVVRDAETMVEVPDSITVTVGEAVPGPVPPAEPMIPARI